MLVIIAIVALVCGNFIGEYLEVTPDYLKALKIAGVEIVTSVTVLISSYMDRRG